jgi:hypothetical protein
MRSHDVTPSPHRALYNNRFTSTHLPGSCPASTNEASLDRAEADFVEIRQAMN